ncbi:MAG: sulfurtransferase TusA family protein [Spirochaetales bacterium]|nr:sulfurtransferase TusA family protein [Spirochaetales bacterium]
MGESIVVDARGLSCPQPVIETKKAIASKPEALSVLVDNVAAKENVTRYANTMGYDVTITQEEDGYTLCLKRR